MKKEFFTPLLHSFSDTRFLFIDIFLKARVITFSNKNYHSNLNNQVYSVLLVRDKKFIRHLPCQNLNILNDFSQTTSKRFDTVADHPYQTDIFYRLQNALATWLGHLRKTRNTRAINHHLASNFYHYYLASFSAPLLLKIVFFCFSWSLFEILTATEQ